MSRRNTKSKKRGILAILLLGLILVAGVVGAQWVEKNLHAPLDNAGEQMTAYTAVQDKAQVFMNGQWYAQRNVETMLVIGIDETGPLKSSGAYNNTNQADFIVLFIRYTDTGESAAIHVNRDVMTDITVLGVTGEKVGTQHAQLALAFNYGHGMHDSSRNTADAVTRLLYGMNVNYYVTVTMDAVAILNDWAGGVTVEILDDFTSVDGAMTLGSEVTLTGEQALAYVRTRKGLDDSTNINRMERQRQYASAWAHQAQNKLKSTEEVASLVVQLSDYHDSDCPADKLAEFAGVLGKNPDLPVYELPGEAVQGEEYMEFYADEEELQQLVLELFYQPVE